MLGAGATRGAQFVGDHNPVCIPPLNADFFTQLQRIATKKHQTTIDGVLRDVLKVYGSNYRVTLEQYVTQLESLMAMSDLVPVTNRTFSAEGLTAMRQRLLNALSAVLEESADVAKKDSIARRHPCRYHRQVVDALEPRDTLITFNYDCLIDHALRTHATGRWSARYGYCFPNPVRVAGHEPWNAESAPTTHNATINLLKLHGSLNWRPLPELSTEEIRLREKPYKQGGDKEYELVPPENSKQLEDKPVLQKLWAHAERALRRAEVICLIGFSFTPTDLHVDSLFGMALAENTRLRRVVIVNPSADHRRAIRSVFRVQLDRDIRLTQFDQFADFAPHAESVLSVE